MKLPVRALGRESAADVGDFYLLGLVAFLASLMHRSVKLRLMLRCSREALFLLGHETQSIQCLLRRGEAARQIVVV
jgi:hypothetical protein